MLDNNDLGRNMSNDITLLMKEELVTGSLNVTETFNVQFAKYFLPAPKECDSGSAGFGHTDGFQLNCDQHDMPKYLLTSSDSTRGQDLIPGVALRKLANVIARPIVVIF